MKMEDLLKQINSFLITNGYVSVIDTEGECIKIKYPSEEEIYNLTLSFPKEFPYVFPSIFVSEEFKKRNNILGHIFKGNSLCLKYDGKESINPTKYIEMTEYALRKAVNIIDKALLNELNEERFDELDQYWELSNENDTRIQALSFYRPYTKGNQQVSFGYFHFNKTKICIYENKKDCYGSDYLELAGGEDSPHIIQCLFIRIKDLNVIYQLKDFRKLITYLYKINDENIKKYLNSHRKSGLINIIDDNESKKIYSVLYLFNEYKNKKIKKDIQDLMPLNSENYKKYNMIPALLDQPSLFERSSNGYVIQKLKHICIVGCGAIGSNLALCYANLGVEEFTLIDNDIFTEKNLLRHLGNIEDMGTNKTIVLKRFLLKNFPYLKINTIAKSIYSVGDEMIHNSVDLMLVATGEITSEYYCLKSFLVENKVPQVMIFWLEPYAVSGHVISYDESKWCKSSFDSLYANINHISSIKNKSDFFKKESGCNSAYIPYSAIDIQIFLNCFVKDVKRITSKSFTYSKLLNIRDARKNPAMKLNEKYHKTKDGEFIIGDIND